MPSSRPCSRLRHGGIVLIVNEIQTGFGRTGVLDRLRPGRQQDRLVTLTAADEAVQPSREPDIGLVGRHLGDIREQLRPFYSDKGRPDPAAGARLRGTALTRPNVATRLEEPTSSTQSASSGPCEDDDDH